MIKAIVFDFDGVIIDTETPHYLSWKEIFRQYNAELDISVWAKLTGSAEVFDVYNHLKNQTDLELNYDILRKRQRIHYLSMVNDNPILPGVLDYFQEALKEGLRLGIASSSDRNWVNSHLIQRGLIQYFTAVKSKDDVVKAKPEPDLFLTALEALGVLPEEAIAIEDSANGVTAAKRAGLYTVAVPNPITKRLILDHADLKIDSLATISLPQLLIQFENDKYHKL